MDVLIIMLLTSACVGGLAYAFMAPKIEQETMRAQRLGAVNVDRSKTKEKASRNRRKSRVADAMQEIEQRQKTHGKPSQREMFEQAGLDWSTGTFVIVSLCAGALSAAAALAGGLGLAVAGVLGLVGAVLLPRFYVKRKRTKRLNAFVVALPDAIDVIVRGVKSGLPLNDCLMIIANDSAEPVKGEFEKVIQAQAAGITISEALERLHRRVPLSETNFLAIVIAIQSQSGGSLSEALANLSTVLRERKKMKGKIKAMAMEAKASAAVIGFLPLIMIALLYLAAPDYISLLFTTWIGNIMLGIGAFMMLVGTLIMRKMINFDF